MSNTPAHSTAKSDLLAPWTYFSAAFFELEKQTLFKREWLFVGHSSEIPKQGDYLTFDGLGERALILRSDETKISAFHNVCRHRGAKVVEAARGNCPRVLNCPFHGWTYHLDGRLKSVPRADTFTDLDIDNTHLVAINLEVWQGFIFINFHADAPSLASQMAPVENRLTPYNLAQLQPLAGSAYRQQRPYNWKVIHDIDNEGYHVPRGHPSLHQLYGEEYADLHEGGVPVSYGRINEQPAKLWSVKNYQKLLPAYAHLPPKNQRLWLYVGVFPSTVIGLYPDMVEIYMSVPSSAATTDYVGACYALPDNRREAKVSRYLTRRINAVTDREDESFVSWVQEGFKSSAFPQAQLSSLEHGVRHLHRKIQHRLPVATLANAPEESQLRAINAQM